MTEKPYQRWRHPPGCPDSDWCSGNDVCYWDCQGDPDTNLARRSSCDVCGATDRPTTTVVAYGIETNACNRCRDGIGEWRW